MDAAGEAFPKLVAVALAAVFAVAGLQLRAEDLVRFVATGKADDLELRRQVAAGGDVVESGDELAIGEIAGGTKDDDGAGLSTVTGEQGLLEGVFQIGHFFGVRGGGD